MTNYVIEGGIDFFAEVARGTLDDDAEDEGRTCLLTGELLDSNHVVMQCGHAFNYEPLFHEVVLQKSHKYAFAHDTIRLSVNQMKCPYCRRVNSKILPYVPLPGCKAKVKGVNSPSAFCMPGKTCSWIFKSGKRKGLGCECAAYEDADGVACALHRRLMKVAKPSGENEEVGKGHTHNTRSLHKLRVVDLREILRSKNLRVGGRKSELIDRILASND
tara:strand:+ start:4668 stop:5318 length:651 start_codon:yes stop_codon:yes gene_type:complete